MDITPGDQCRTCRFHLYRRHGPHCIEGRKATVTNGKSCAIYEGKAHMAKKGRERNG